MALIHFKSFILLLMHYMPTHRFLTPGLRKTFDNDKDGHVSPTTWRNGLPIYAVIQPGQQAEKLKQTLKKEISGW